MVTQVAVHHARTELDDAKRTKTRRSVRIAAVHGNTEKVLYSNYQRPDLTDAAAKTSDYLRLVG